MPQVLAFSSGFDESWLPQAERLILGFGDRQDGSELPAHGIRDAVNRAAGGRGPRHRRRWCGTRLRDRSAVPLSSRREERLRGIHPRSVFVARIVEPTWEGRGSLPALMIPAEAFLPRTLAQCKKSQAHQGLAPREGEDPERRTLFAPSKTRKARPCSAGRKFWWMAAGSSSSVLKATWRWSRASGCCSRR